MRKVGYEKGKVVSKADDRRAARLKAKKSFRSQSEGTEIDFGKWLTLISTITETCLANDATVTFSLTRNKKAIKVRVWAGDVISEEYHTDDDNLMDVETYYGQLFD